MAKSPPRIYLSEDVTCRLIKLSGKIDGLPTVLANSFVDDCLKAIEDNRVCLPDQPREHLVPLSVNVVRAMLRKTTTLLFQTQKQ